MKLSQLTNADRELVEQTALALDPRRYNRPDLLREFLTNIDVKNLMRRAGVDVGALNRKTYRRFRKEVFERVANQDTTKPFGNIADAYSAEWIYKDIRTLLNRKIHRGNLPLQKDAVILFCLDRECVLGCRKAFTEVDRLVEMKCFRLSGCSINAG